MMLIYLTFIVQLNEKIITSIVQFQTLENVSNLEIPNSVNKNIFVSIMSKLRPLKELPVYIGMLLRYNNFHKILFLSSLILDPAETL
jgi:hypothetical protein